MNTYAGITDCYDLLMRAGYYDHQAMARAADAVMGDRKRALELGVGTGLFAQSLAEVNPDRDITGVDITHSMLEVAEERVGDTTELIEADVTSMNLGRTFDTAISSGGVWVVIRDEDEYLLGTHLDYESDRSGLENVSDHLDEDGLMLLSIQDMHHDFEQELDEDLVYSQRVTPTGDADAQHFTLEKEYRFTRGTDVIAGQTLELGFYRRDRMDHMLEDAGFAFNGVDRDGRFFVYSKETAGAGAPN